MTRVYRFTVSDRTLNNLELTLQVTLTYEDWCHLGKQIAAFDANWPAADLIAAIREMLRDVRNAVEPHLYVESDE